MSNAADEPERDQGYISDEQLPEDLRPEEDNPLAQNPEEGGEPADTGPLSASQEAEAPGTGEKGQPPATDKERTS
jgi:hypothetical protein